MDFCYTVIYVPDVLKAIEFYEKAFDLKRNFIHESLEYGELDTGNTKISFVSESLANLNRLSFVSNDISSSKSAGFTIAFITDKVLSAYKQAISAGAISVYEPTEKFWGQMVACVKDLNGVLVEISSPIKK